MQSPLLTANVLQAMITAKRAGHAHLKCSLDLQRTVTSVTLRADHWSWQQTHYPYPERLNERTVYHFSGTAFEPVSRFSGSLIKLVPTDWGPPTFEIDGIKMLPSARVSPYADAEHKVGLIRPRGKVILDCCGGLGYFAACCLKAGAQRILSFEINPDVLWLRTLNPWSPAADETLTLMQGDITQAVMGLADGSVGAVLHDPPRFGIAGELYSQAFYDELARVLIPRGLLFHYTGAPNKVSSGRDLAGEVIQRLRLAGFEAHRQGDGILATRQRRSRGLAQMPAG